MIWIFLLYVLPLVVSIIGAYFAVKQREGYVEEFIGIIPWLFIPIANIIFILIGIYFIIHEWLENDDDWQNFLNKKL